MIDIQYCSHGDIQENWGLSVPVCLQLSPLIPFSAQELWQTDIPFVFFSHSDIDIEMFLLSVCSGYFGQKHTVRYFLTIVYYHVQPVPVYQAFWIKCATCGWDYFFVFLSHAGSVSSDRWLPLVIRSEVGKWDFSCNCTFDIVKGHVFIINVHQYNIDGWINGLKM